MQKKIAIRLILGLFAIAVLFLGYNKFKEFAKDPNASTARSTAGMIAAIRLESDGARAVAFRANGDMIESPDWKPGMDDQQISWSPTGSRVFMSTNRTGRDFNIFAWYPENNIVEQRSTSSRSQSVPWYPLWASPADEPTGIITSGGFVLSFDPKEQTTRQILPPVAKDRAAGEEGGASSTLDMMYSQLGTSFREAKWGPAQEMVYALMRRDAGELLILNRLYAEDARMLVPVPYRAGKEIQFDTTPKGGAVVAIRGFQFPDPENVDPQYIENGKVVLPYKNELSAITIGADGTPQAIMIAIVNDDTNIFYDPAVSPDGTKVAIVIVQKKGEVVTPIGLVVMPIAERGAEKGTQLVSGDVSMPSWSPDGKMLTYLKRLPGGNNAVFTINADGTGERQLTDEGDFTSPKFSPSKLSQ